ncbi:MAG: nuclease-related domain-containing protein [Gammaproteobacteria bacterium]|jgi:hypothetical protein|nr:nuclease-related domain-containing protein [Gammaproteobacteria bacterium]
MPTDNLTLGLMLGGGLVALSVLLWLRRRQRNTPAARLRRACREMLTQVFVPDGEGGQIHIEYLLLCPRGIVIINVKDVSGNVFGSDAMREWAVITGSRRHGIRNPQDGLFDRLAAVRRLVPTLPVHGYIAFTATANFSKGVPTHVVLLEQLIDELTREAATTNTAYDAYLPGWETLKQAAITA